MKKALLLVVILFVSVLSTACINNLAVQELNNKAKDYLNKGDYENAIGRLKSSIDLDSTIFESHYNLGIAYTQAKRYDEAIESFNNASKLNSEFADIYYSIAVAQENYAKGIIDGSIKDNNKDEDIDNPKKEDEENTELTDEQKTKIVKLFEDSISSYQKYLEKGKDISDRNEVEEKITYLQSQITKYSNNEEEQIQ